MDWKRIALIGAAVGVGITALRKSSPSLKGLDAGTMSDLKRATEALIDKNDISPGTGLTWTKAKNNKMDIPLLLWFRDNGSDQIRDFDKAVRSAMAADARFSLRDFYNSNYKPMAWFNDGDLPAIIGFYAEQMMPRRK